MSIRKAVRPAGSIAMIMATFAFIALAATFSPHKAQAGILGGALGGAIVGGLIGGKKGAQTGAIIGGIAGAIRR